MKYERGNPFNIVNIENKLPKVIPDLPLKYSKRSGFFFCGIIDEPVTILSERLIRLKPSEFQIINSSEILDKCNEQTETL